MRARSKAWLVVTVATGLAFLLSACGSGRPQDTLSPQGPEARKIDVLFKPVFWIAVVVFILVEGVLAYALVRFRHKPGREAPAQVHGNRRLEIGWTIIPTLLLAGIAVPTIGTIFSLAAKPAGNVLEVTVTGHQWWWQVEYPGLGVVTANEVHIPAGRPVYITLSSKDVIHSFWVPRLAGTQDLEPGRTNHLTIQADEPGVYLGQCKEYCGLSHANMRFRVIAQTEADFQAWAQQQIQLAAPPGAEALAVMRQVGCGGCHTIGGVEGFGGILGPDLTHFGSRTTFAGGMLENNEANLTEWFRDPQHVKPGNDMTIAPGLKPGPSGLSDDQIRALIVYLESLQ
jgi:cytochrome c oxidase subunit 2